LSRRNAFVLVLTTGLMFPYAGCNDMGVTPPPAAVHVDTVSTVSFQNNVIPIFDRFGCYECHGGTNGLMCRRWPTS
jgi:hypothetical protein